MSKIGRQPIRLPDGATLSQEGRKVTVQGPKGTLSWEIPFGIKVKEENGMIRVDRSHNSKDLRAYHGLSRALLANMIKGVSEGFEKKLKMVGVGYRAEPTGNGLKFSLGYSHPIDFPTPEGIELKLEKNIIAVLGIDKQLVGETAARIRSLRKPEPYKGKGIMYVDEQIRRKAGKAAKAVGSGAGA